MNVGGLFTCKEGYNYNRDSFAYTDCKLLKDVGSLPKGTCIPEALINYKNGKIKFNVDEKLVIIPYTFTWCDSNIVSKKADEVDSDFDGDSDTGSDSSSDSEECT